MYSRARCGPRKVEHKDFFMEYIQAKKEALEKERAEAYERGSLWASGSGAGPSA